MALTLSSLPGLVDVPDASLASGNVCLDSLLAKISQNAKFGLVRPEIFYGEYQDGDTVPLPVSPVDGYVYTAGECQYVWALRYGYNRDSGKPSAKGQLLLESTEVDQGTGQVSILKAYYAQGGQQTNTTDGILAVWTIAQRGRDLLALAGSPTFTDIADSAFAQDAPVSQSSLTNLSHNTKRAAVSTECFFDPGGALSGVSVAAAGAGYQVNDILALNQPGASGGKVRVTSIASGGGQLDQVSLYNPGSGYQVNDILTIVQAGASGGQIQVTAVDASGHITGLAIYASGQGYTAPSYQLATTGGHGSGCTANVLSVTGYGAVTGVAICADPVSGSKGSLYLAANSVPTQGGEGSGCTINITAVTAIGYTNGETVPLPVSAVDGYAYSRSELTYFPFWIYTGKSDRSGPSGGGRIRLKTLSVNPSTGVLSCGVHYWDGHTDTATNDGIIGVLTFATRTMPALGATAGTFTDVNDAHFWATALLGDSYLQEVNRNAKFANLRPEIFTATYTNGQAVSLPTSSRDSYAYSRAELQYVYSVANTGSVPDGDIVGENFQVDPTTGMVNISVDLQTTDGHFHQTSGATLFVVTLARRAHETADVSFALPGSAQSTAAPPPPLWLECQGEHGLFSLALAAGAGTGLAAVRYQIQFADDANFTQNLETLDLGGDPYKTWREPNRRRYCRAAAAYADSPWSDWAVFGTPAPLLSQVAGGSLPARTYYVQIAYSGILGALFRVSVAAGGSGYNVGDVLSLVGGGGTGGKVQVGTVDGTGKVTSIGIYNAGSGYSAKQTVPTTGGAGSGCTVYIRQVMYLPANAVPSGEVAVSIAAGYLLQVASPPPNWPYGQYYVYASETPGGEQYQSNPLLGYSWTELASGLETGTGSPPAGDPTAVASGNITDNVADYVIHQGTAASGSSHSYRQINSGVNYAVASGDVLEFDQIVDVSSADVTGGIDFLYGPTGTEYRASASQLADQNGLSISPSTDLSVYANGQWYHRKFDLASIVGNTIGSAASALLGSGSGFYKGRVANVRITNRGDVQAIIYSSGGVGSGPIWTPGGENFTSVGIGNLEGVSGQQVNWPLLLGYSVPKQTSGGPEMLGFDAPEFNHVIIGSWVQAEANARWLLSAYGFMEWGPGGSGDQDVALFRNWAGGLAIQSFNNTASDHAFSVHKNTGDGSVGQSVLRVDLSSTTKLVNIENGARLAINGAAGGALLDILGSSGVTSYRILGASAGDPAFLIGVSGENYGRLTSDHAGGLSWSSGAALPDVLLYRSSAAELTLQGSLGVDTAGDAYARIWVDKSGYIALGPGNAVADADLARQGDGSIVLQAGGENGNAKLAAVGTGKCILTASSLVTGPLEVTEGATLDSTLKVTGKTTLWGDLQHSGSNFGVFGIAATSRQTVTGSKGGNDALASLVSALATYGLVIDNST